MSYLSGFIEFFFISLPMILPAMLFIIVIHELGHYWAGRLLGAKAEAFSIGFGKEIWGWTDRLGTRWRIARWPLGGYVKFLGDGDASSTPTEQSKHVQGSLESLSIWRKMIIILAGPGANFVLTLLIFTALFWTLGTLRVKPVIGKVETNSPAMAAGFLNGDEIKSVNGVQMKSRTDVIQIISANPLQDFHFKVRGIDGSVRELSVRPKKMQTENTVTGLENRWRIGIIFSNEGLAIEEVQYGLPEAVMKAGSQMVFIVNATVRYFGRLVSLQDTPEDLSGIARIAETSKRYTLLSFSSGENLGEKFFNAFIQILNLTAGISLSIGIINLLPILPLDGGRFVVYAGEGLFGRSMSLTIQKYAIIAGLLFIACLFTFIMINDVVWLTKLFASG